MIKSNKTFSLLAVVVICSLLMAAGCAQPAAESAKPAVEAPVPETAESKTICVEPEKPVPPIVEKGVIAPVPALAEPEAPAAEAPSAESVTLALKFTEGDSTTYRMTAESEKNIDFEGPVTDEEHFKGGRTFNRVEMVFTQQIQDVRENGNAVAKITIKQLNQITQVKNKLVQDFDSTRNAERDKNDPLAKLIGQSYLIEISPDGRVPEVIDATQARAAVEGDSPANQNALKLLESKSIMARHEIPSLSALDKDQLKSGENWSNVETLSFGLMGTKSYEKIYTLKKINQTNGNRIALITMDAIPASSSDSEPANRFSESFDNTEKYTGQTKLNLTTGKAEDLIEKVQLKWVTVEPTDAQNENKEPIILKMDTTLFRSLVLIN